MNARNRRTAPRHAASLSEQLRATIAARKGSTHGLAKLADVAPSILSRFLSGERGLSMDSIDRLALALGLRLTEPRTTPAIRRRLTDVLNPGDLTNGG